MTDHNDLIDVNAPAPPGVARARAIGLALGVIAGIACIIGAMADPNQFFHSYLMAFMFWLGVSLGSLAVAMMQYLTGGVWGFLMRRPLEAASRALPLLLVLFVPILLGLDSLYPWTLPAVRATDQAIQAKSGYLNVPFFIVRAAIYFAVWLFLAWRINGWSAANDRTGDPVWLRKLGRFSGPGLVIYAFTITFASVDWVMSLEPHWFSTIFGMIFMTGQGLSALAFAALVLVMLSRDRPLSDLLRVTSMRDVGNMMLAFVMLWAYMSFSQLLLIWAGNLPEEIPWYVHRLGPGWQWVGLSLAVFHFFIPFVLLLMRRTKRVFSTLRAVVLLLLFMRLVDLFWMVGPETHQGRFVVSWQDFAATIAIGGLFVAVFAWQFGKRSLLPQNDPLELMAALRRH